VALEGGYRRALRAPGRGYADDRNYLPEQRVEADEARDWQVEDRRDQAHRLDGRPVRER
jgi:hypothetical protein